MQRIGGSIFYLLKLRPKRLMQSKAYRN